MLISPPSSDRGSGAGGDGGSPVSPHGTWLEAAGMPADGLLEHLPLQMPALEQRGAVTRTFRRLDPERQMEVIAAILGAAADAGPHGVGVRAVAARARISVDSPCQYFPDRRGMVGATAEIAGELLAAEFDAGADLESSARFVLALTLALGDSKLLPHLDGYYRRLDGASLEQRAAQLADFVLAALKGEGMEPPSGEGSS